MKIVFLSPGFFPKIGGVEKHALEIALRLRKLGHMVTVITEAKQPRRAHSNVKQLGWKSDSEAKKSDRAVKSVYFDTYFVKGVRVVSFKYTSKSFFKKFKIWALLFKVLNEFKEADIIHCHDVFVWYLPIRFVLPWKKVFITFHGYEGYPLTKKNILIRKLSEVLTNGNICVGSFIKKWYGTKSNLVIYGGVNIYRSNKKIPTPSALFYGRLDDQTGILEYVEGVEKIKEKIPQFNFTIIGEGQLKNRISDKFDVSPFTSNPERKLANYRYAFVSRYLSMLEAMIQKRLVIAHYDNPIKKDYLLMSPFAEYVEVVRDSDELAKKVLYFVSHEREERQKVESAYNWAKNQSWDNVCRSYLKLWGRESLI